MGKREPSLTVRENRNCVIQLFGRETWPYAVQRCTVPPHKLAVSLVAR